MLLSSVRCTGAVLSLDATSKGFWNNHAVIFAQVTEMHQADGITTIQLQIIAVELTTLPIAAEGFIAKGALNAPESAAHADVTKGSFVLCCVGYSSDGWELERNGISCMPKGSSVVVVKSPNDPELYGVLHDIRAAYLSSTKQ
jgi:hypothetical protein